LMRLAMKGIVLGLYSLSLPTASRRVMVIGIIEGILISPTFNAPKKDLYWIEQCITGTTDHQIETIITRYADAHPEYWNWNIGLLAHNAMKDVCPH